MYTNQNMDFSKVPKKGERGTLFVKRKDQVVN